MAEVGLCGSQDPPHPEFGGPLWEEGGGPAAFGGDCEAAGGGREGGDVVGGDVGEAGAGAAAGEVGDAVAASFVPGEDAADAVGPEAEEAVLDDEVGAFARGLVVQGAGGGVEGVDADEAEEVAHLAPDDGGGEGNREFTRTVDSPVFVDVETD